MKTIVKVKLIVSEVGVSFSKKRYECHEHAGLFWTQANGLSFALCSVTALMEPVLQRSKGGVKKCVICCEEKDLRRAKMYALNNYQYLLKQEAAKIKKQIEGIENYRELL